MRRLFCLGIVAAAVLAIPTAQAVSSPAVTLNVSKFQVRYGDPLHLAGTVSNHKAGVSVGVFARAFTSSGFTRVATVTTGANGRVVVRREARNRDHLPGAHRRQREPHAARGRASGGHADTARQRPRSASRSARRARSPGTVGEAPEARGRRRGRRSRSFASTRARARSCRRSLVPLAVDDAARDVQRQPGRARATSARSARRWCSRRAGSRCRSRRRRSRSATRSC